MSHANENTENVDLKSLQIIGHGVCNLTCHKSMCPNLCSKLQKESADHNGENKERRLIKNHTHR